MLHIFQHIILRSDAFTSFHIKILFCLKNDNNNKKNPSLITLLASQMKYEVNTYVHNHDNTQGI